ncbi:MAG: thioredoxin-like domain-containing protein [Gemmatales bacterium]|nr:thioredoxin-like domain-containing protein [Gemmatales bacterium]MDW7994926.1 thioredoxin-like domain-containing protein [Gemmatales bacterium]
MMRIRPACVALLRATSLIVVSWLSSQSPLWATPTVEQMLAFQPKQKGVAISTPTAREYAQCQVELVQGTQPGASGWMLRDPQGRILRRYMDTNGDRYPDQWCYYKDGVEVYREMDTNFNGKADRYVWLHTAGMKIGLDPDEDGLIDEWSALSPQELSQVALQAIVAKDYRLFQTLLVKEQDLQALGLPARELERIRELRKHTPQKFQNLCTSLPHLNESTRWLHFDVAIPGRIPADSFGMKRDVLMIYRSLIIAETAGKQDVIQLGELVLVGEAWKLVDLPGPSTASDQTTAQAPDELQTLLRQLAELDQKHPSASTPGPNPALARFYLDRAQIIEAILTKVREPADRSLWVKQLADTLGSAAQVSPQSDRTAMNRLMALAQQLQRSEPNSDLAAYVTFREINTDYAVKSALATKPEDILTLQNAHVERLVQFVKMFPKAPETAEALWQIAMHLELQNKEAEAKNYYLQLVRNFPSNNPNVTKAQGALRRLDLDGKSWELTVPVISLNGQNYNPATLRGKVVIVYYYASWCKSVPEDFVRLRKLQQELGSHALEIIGINIDENQNDALALVRNHNPPGIQLYAGGGPDGPAATYYGLMAFPHIFLLGRDGKVLDHALEMSSLEAMVRKAVNR